MADLTIVVSQAEIAEFINWLLALSALGAALGAGLVGLLRTALLEAWYWIRISRRRSRMQRRTARLAHGQGNGP